MLFAIIFSFIHVFCPINDSDNHFRNLEFFLCKCFEFGLVQKIVNWQRVKMNFVYVVLRVALQILGQKFYKNTKNSSLYSQTLLIFIHRTPVVERHLITREMRNLLWPGSTPTGNTFYFYMSSTFIYTLKIHKASKILFDEDIKENNYMFNMSCADPDIFLKGCVCVCVSHTKN